MSLLTMVNNTKKWCYTLCFFDCCIGSLLEALTDMVISSLVKNKSFIVSWRDRATLRGISKCCQSF